MPPTATVVELETAFTRADYFRQMSECRRHGLGWALVHLVLVMPDICASLSDERGEASGAAYKAWCNDNLPDELLTGADWWAMRNMVLHTGRTIPNREGSQYAHFEFEPPEGTSHKLVETPGDRRVITINVGNLHDEVLAKMRRWFECVERGAAPGAEHVRTHLELLVRVKPRNRRSGEQVQVARTSVPTSTTSSIQIQESWITYTPRQK